MPLMSFVGNLGYVGVALSGGFLAIKGLIGIGDIQAFIQYVRNLTEPMQQVAQVVNQVQSMTAAAERVFEFLEEEEEEATRDAVTIDGELSGSVDFEHVRFGYKVDQPVIKDFTVRVEPGQKIAIVGPTGAGKTTIVKLLMRFYDVDAGAIKLDGININNIDRRELRKNFGMVVQDTWLFKGSIMENIRYGRLDATDEEVKVLNIYPVSTELMNIPNVNVIYKDGQVEDIPKSALLKVWMEGRNSKRRRKYN